MKLVVSALKWTATRKRNHDDIFSHIFRLDQQYGGTPPTYDLTFLQSSICNGFEVLFAGKCYDEPFCEIYPDLGRDVCDFFMLFLF